MRCSRFLPIALAVGVFYAGAAFAQQPPPLPWTGIAANEARPNTPQQYGQGSNEVTGHAMSADGRFVVFDSNLSHLVYGDVNGFNDVFMRDRQTGELSLISRANDGSQGNSYSAWPTISANGRYVAFNSCASNFVPADTNGCDIFIRDNVTGTIVRGNLGPNGEQATITTQHAFRLSGDGRYLLFVGGFEPDLDQATMAVWLRDRDTDGNGVFDEPGLTSSTQISVSTFGDYALDWISEVAISNDGRWIAYTAETYVDYGHFIGTHIYLYDPINGTTALIDRTTVGTVDEYAYSSSPDFSDAGLLAYSSNANNLTESDSGDYDYDVFVFNVLTGGNTLVPTHAGETGLIYVWSPAISADGRYVAYTKATPDQWGWQYHYNIYAVDRQSGFSTAISTHPDGTLDNNTGAPSISADGLSIAFHANPETLVWAWGNTGIFVATGVDLTPAHIDVPAEGGTFSIEVTVPQGIAWTLTPTGMNVSQSSGVGPATIDVTLPANTLPDEQDYVVALGSKQVTLHQALAPQIYWVWPYEGSPHGGTDVTINGANFADGATVAFDGVPATNVVFLDSTTLHATTPAHPVGFVDVTVTNPGGASATFQWGFNYVDDTPPVVTYEVAGTLGQNGFYTSDVQVTFHYEDPESEVFDSGCASPFQMTWDAAYAFAICNVYSQGGQTTVDVDVKRDTMPPSVYLAPAYDDTFAQGQQIPIAKDCYDMTSGIASCTANQPGPYLDTSTVGTFVYSVTGVDMAGHSATASINYTVKMLTGVTMPVVTAVYGNATASLRATLTGPTNPVPGKTITFFVDNVAVGSAVTAANGEAIFNYPLAGRNAGSWEMHAEFGGDDTAFANMMSSALNIAKATPVVTWANPAFIVAGTPLGSTQLNATASIPGTFDYTPGFSAVLPAGTQTLSVLFTPQDAVNYELASKTVSLTVKAVPVITWAPPAAITYPATLAAAQLNATANVAGTFVYSPPAGTLLDAGTHTISVTFTPTNTAAYVSESSTTMIEVLKGNATLNWATPYPLTYGMPLTGLQLNATASAAGSFAYTPPSGTVLNAGTHTLTATFTPDSPSNYYPGTVTVDLVVGRKAPTVFWPGELTSIIYPTPIDGVQLNATSPNAGTFSYNPPAGTVLNAGIQTITLTFTPDDTANYQTVTTWKQISVLHALSTVTWNNPAPIVYGTRLSATQLNATSSLAGSYLYTPGELALLTAGTHTLNLLFIPNNTNYFASQWTVTLVVEKKTPVMTLSVPAPITYGTPLHYDVSATGVTGGGHFTMNPPEGTVLNAGAAQTVTATFTPNDAVNYNPVSDSRTIDVVQATPTITWPSPGGITYGTPLSVTQLNASASVAGTFEYSPLSGTVVPAGTQTLTATFTPTNSNYAAVTTTRSLAVAKAASGLAWSAPAAVPYPTALSATQLNATATTPGTFAYSQAPGTVLAPGVHQITVTFTPSDPDNFNAGTATVNLTVNQTTPALSWASPASIVYPTALSATQLNATADVPGAFTYNWDAGTVLPAGTHALNVTFRATDPNYNTATATVNITVTKGTPIVSWSNPAPINYGTQVSNVQLNATVNVAGSKVYSPAAGTLLNAGTYTLNLTFTPFDTNNYNGATANVTLTVNKATPVLSWAQPANIQYGTALSSTQYNASANVAGSFAYSPAAGTVPHSGGVSMTATFTPSDPANYNTPASLSKTIFVSKAPLTLQVNNASKVYGQALPVFSTTGTGFVNGDTLASVSSSPAYNTTATATSAPGNYPVTLSNYSSLDYTITALGGTLTVTKASTSVVLTTTPNPSVNNQQVQLRAVVSAVAPGAGTPTGTIEFRENGSLFATATVVNGVATLGRNFKKGSHPLTATYVGDANFTGSTGSVTHQTN